MTDTQKQKRVEQVIQRVRDNLAEMARDESLPEKVQLVASQAWGLIGAHCHDLEDVPIIQQDKYDRDAFLALDDYKAQSLAWLLRQARGTMLDTGDWCGVLLRILEEAGYEAQTDERIEVRRPSPQQEGEREPDGSELRELVGDLDDVRAMLPKETLGETEVKAELTRVRDRLHELAEPPADTEDAP